MTKRLEKIGPTFGAEVIEAGLGGLPISWGEDGDVSFDDLTPAQKSKLTQVINAHDPEKQIESE
nr:hypothetical protein EVB34_055 [Rhizobium phage RHph_TM26]